MDDDATAKPSAPGVIPVSALRTRLEPVPARHQYADADCPAVEVARA